MLLSYTIKYLPYLIVKFQVAIDKKLLLARCRAFKHVESTTIYMIKIFHLHYRESALLQSSFFIVTKLTNICQPISSIDSREKNLSKYIYVFNLFKSLGKHFHTNSIISIRPRNLHINLSFAANLSFQRNSLIELTAKHMTWCFWLNSDKINSTHCKICQICHREKLPQKNC